MMYKKHLAFLELLEVPFNVSVPDDDKEFILHSPVGLYSVVVSSP